MQMAEEISLNGGVISLYDSRHMRAYHPSSGVDCSDNCDCSQGGDCYCTDCNEGGEDEYGLSTHCEDCNPTDC